MRKRIKINNDETESKQKNEAKELDESIKNTQKLGIKVWQKDKIKW